MKKIFLIFSFVVIFPFLTACLNSTSEEPKTSFDENSLEKAPTNHDLTFFVTTDWHYLSNNLTDNGEAYDTYIKSGDAKQLQDMDTILDAFSDQIADELPEVLIVSGDLTNNGEKKSHQDIAEKLTKIEKHGTSVFVIPGNHDIDNPWARRFKEDKQYKVDTISATEFGEIYSDFGYEEAISEDSSSLSYLATPAEDVWLLMLDTNQYSENATKGFPEISGEISDDTLSWIKACFDFAEEKGATIIPVIHHNLIDHNNALSKGYTLNNNLEVSDLLQTYKTPLVLSGHIHAQDISSVKTDYGKMYDIATSALSVYPQQYGVLSYSNHGLDYQTSKVDVDIEKFDEYSKNYFGKFAADMIYEKVIVSEDLSQEEVKYLAETMKILNIRFFSGTEFLNEQDLILDDRFKLWQEIPNEFFKKYVQSIQSDHDTQDNQLHIELLD